MRYTTIVIALLVRYYSWNLQFNREESILVNENTAVENDVIRSKERVVVIDGNTFTIVREFNKKGATVLNQTINILIDKMNNKQVS